MNTGVDFSTEGEDRENNFHINSLPIGFGNESKSEEKCSSRSSGPYSAMVR